MSWPYGTPAGQRGSDGLAGWTQTAAGLLVPAPPPGPQYDAPVGVDLFAGAGGFSLGCTTAGYHMAAAVERDPVAAVTYMVNLARPGVQIHFDTPEREAQFTAVLERHLGLRHGRGQADSASAPRGQPDRIAPAGQLAGGGWISTRPATERGCEHFFVADVRNVTGADILAALGLDRGDVDVVVGGPPCQGFSRANSNRSVMDPRNSLVMDFARLVLEIRPKAFVMENVPEVATMLTPDGVPVIDAFARVLADGGFGGYTALRASLTAQAGTAAALRSDSATPRATRRGAGPAAATGQLSFLDLEAGQ